MKRSEIPSNPRVLLYGYGKEGQSSEAWAKTHLEPSVIDIYEDIPEAPLPQWSDYDLVIKSPGVPPSKIPAAHWSKVTSNLRLLLENLTPLERQKVIGITGSKGKSTTAKFTHQLLQTAGFKSTIIGNFGIPALEVFGKLDQYDFIVAECSSFQLYDLEVSPHFALFLSFFSDHLDWHNDSEIDYFAAKANLWRHQAPTDYLFVPEGLPEPIKTRLEATVEGPNLTYTGVVPEELFPVDSHLRANHFRQNLGTVWQLAQTLPIDNIEAVWLEASAAYQPIEHRLETVRTVNSLTFINDSIATSPEATVVGVNYLAEKLSGLIIDGADLGVGSFQSLVETINQKAPNALVALIDSEVSQKFISVAAAKSLNTKTFTRYEDALEWLSTQAKPGSILFSPAGKSFNRFQNYQQRGQNFKSLVQNLAL